MLQEAFELMLVGMGAVLAFLALLVAAMHVAGAVFGRFASEAPEATAPAPRRGAGEGSDQAAAMAVAVAAAFRARGTGTRTGRRGASVDR